MSTAALMHDRFADRLPLDAEPLSVEGYFCVTTDDFQSWRDEVAFHVVKRDRPENNLYSARVQFPSISCGDIRPARITIQSPPYMSPELARVCSEVLYFAGELGRMLDANLHELHAEKIAEQQREREERQRRREEEREARLAEIRKQQEEQAARQAAQKELNQQRKEKLQWHLGDKFRLKRRHHRTGQPMKAIVFGTIDTFLDHGDRVVMLTTSEKGKKMRIYLDTIIHMELKEHEADKRYSNKVIVDG